MSGTPTRYARIGLLIFVVFFLLVGEIILFNKNIPSDIQSSRSTASMTSTVSHSATWCPFAICEDSPICRPCQRRFLIILATGRSASTTLTWMMDLLPGIRMSGENNDALGHLRSMLKEVTSRSNFKLETKLLGPWSHNRIPQGAFACPLQHFIETMTPPLLGPNGLQVTDDQEREDIVGFKTIRFLQNSSSEMDQQSGVNFIKKHFPCSRIIVNIRSDIYKQSESRKKAFNTASNPGVLSRENKRLLNVARMFGPEQAFVMDSSVWTKNLTAFNAVVEWLGFNQDCFFRDLLELNTKNSYMATKTTAHYLGSNCTLKS